MRRPPPEGQSQQAEPSYPRRRTRHAHLEPGARYHASVEEGVTARAIAEAIGKGTGLPVRSVAADEVERYFGWMAPFASLDMIASNAWTRARLGWKPTGPDLLTDLAAMDFLALAEA